MIRTRMKVLAVAVSVAVAVQSGAAAAPTPAEVGGSPIEVFVSPDGADGDGTFEAPFGSLTDARDAVRALIADGMTTDVHVILRDGTYFLQDTFQLDERDSGRDGHRVVYTNYLSESPVIVGGTEIQGTWEETSNPDVLRVAIPQIDDAQQWFDQLFVSGERQTLARFPSEGYLQPRGTEGNLRQFDIVPGDLPEWSDYANAQVVVWSSAYFSDTIEVSEIDYETSTITLAQDMLRSPETGQMRRYFLQGVRQALDQPGEFYFDKDEGYLYYWPADPSFDGSDVVVPTLQNVIELVGSSPQQPVSGVDISGLTFQGSAFTSYFNETHGGEWNRPADENANGIIYAENVEDVTITENIISNAGFSGVVLHRSAVNNSVIGNEIRDFGYHGVLLMGTASGVVDENNDQIYDNRGNVVSDNHIHHGGKLVGHGSGVFIHQSGANLVEHNVIHDLDRYAIAAKGPNHRPLDGDDALDPLLTSRDNMIRYNDISHVLEDSDDAGAITFTTTGTGNVIAHNRIHKINAPLAYHGHVFGIYLDNWTSYTEVYGNIIHGVDGAGGYSTALNATILSKGHRNRIVNNVLVQDAGTPWAAGISYGGVAGNVNQTFANETLRNVVAMDSGADLVYDYRNWDGDNLEASDFNLFYQADGDYRVTGVPGVQDLADWQSYDNSRYDQNSIVADPMFRNPTAGDYVMSPMSPAYQLGFTDLDYSAIGTTGDIAFGHGDLDALHVTAEGQISRLSLDAGESGDLAATARDANGIFIAGDEVTLSYSSADPTVATVDAAGTVVAHAAGVTEVTVEASDGSQTVETAIPIYVGELIQEVQVEGGNPLAVGQETALRAIAFTTHGTSRLLDPATDDVTFVSDDETVASVDERGGVIALSPGEATITASVSTSEGMVAGTFTVVVHTAILASLEVTRSGLGLPVGDAAPLEVTAYMSDGSEADPSELQLSYASSDESIAVVDARGVVTGVQRGNATISVTAHADGIQRIAEETVYVVQPSELPAGWAHSDIGDWDDRESYVQYDDGTWRLHSNGLDAWRGKDAVTFVHQFVDRSDYVDGIAVIATVESVSEIHANSMAGLMIRATSDAGAQTIAPRLRPGGAMPVGLRQTPGGATLNISSNPILSFPATIKLSLVGNTIEVSYLNEGDWVDVAQDTLVLPDVISIGIWNASADPSGLSEAVFSDVQVVAEPAVPATGEALLGLSRALTIALAHEVTGSAASYPALSRAALLHAIDGAESVLQSLNPSEGQVTRAQTELDLAVANFESARTRPSLMELDFENDSVGQEPASVNIITPAQGNVVVTSEGADGGQAMRITGFFNPEPQRFRADVALAPADNGRATYLTQFKREAMPGAFLMSVGDATGQYAARLWFVGNGSVRLRYPDGSSQNVGSHVEGEWYTVEFTVDVGAATFDISINDQKLVDGERFMEPVEAVERMEWESGAGTYWIDDVVGYAIEGDDARAASITVDGEPLAGFDADVTAYTVELPPDADVPDIHAEPSDAEATTYVSQPEEVPGTGYIVAISASRLEHRLYEVEFVCGSQNEGENVVFSGVDSGVGNHARADGCTFMDLVQSNMPFVNHGEFVRLVRDLAKQWQADGLFTPREVGALTMAAARSDVGR